MNNNSSFLAVLDNITALTVIGVQAGQFLQGQFTCDVLALQDQQAMLGACCDHKGRMLMNGWVGRGNNEWMLFIPKNMAELTLAHLQKFAVFSKVSFSEKNGWKALGYFSPNPPVFATHGCIQHQSPAYHKPGYMLYYWFGPEKTLDLLQAEIQNNASLIDASHLAIMMQLVLIQPTTRELFIPQMLGLEKLGGISFKKGCYVGQEIVARTQHLGQLKRHLHSFLLTHSAQPQVGDAIHNAAQEIVGHIAAMSVGPKQGYQLLAVIQDRAMEHELFFQHQILKKN